MSPSRRPPPPPPRGGRPQPPGGRPSRRASLPTGPGREKYQRLLLDGERFFKDKDYQTAFKIYQQALAEAPPGDHQALSQLCRCYRKKARKALKKDDFTQVADLLNEMMQLKQVQAHLKGRDYQVLAEASLELGRLEAAAEAIRQALDLNPELAGDIHSLQKRLKTELLHREMKGLH